MPFPRFLLLACAAALTLPMPSPGQAQDDANTRRIEGSATYLARIALPPDARLQLEARSPFGESLALSETATEGAQVPLPFAVTVPAWQPVQLAVALLSGPDTLWLSGLIDVPANEGPTALGEVVLHPFQPFGFDFELLCGKDLRLSVGFSGDDALVRTLSGTVPLTVQVSASGARFASADGRTEVWTKGGSALVTLDGADQGECRFVPPAPPAAWVGRGQEPGWSARVEGGRLALTRQEGDGLELALTAKGIRDGSFLYAGSTPEGVALEAALTPGLCHDSMSGMPHPDALVLRLGDEELSGCGGEPLALLTGPEWVVEDIGGQGIIDNSHMTLRVGTGGEVAGSGGCNRFMGAMTLSGEGVAFGPLGGTMMACAEALMDQENRLHQALGTVDGFDIDETGALHLRSGAGTAVLLRR